MKSIKRPNFHQKSTTIRSTVEKPIEKQESKIESKHEYKNESEKLINIQKNVKKEMILNESSSSSVRSTFDSIPTNIYVYSSCDVGECHHCRHSYTGDGIGIPFKRIDIKKNSLSSTIYDSLVKDKFPECKILFVVKDCFCSFECAYANILQTYSHTKIQEDILGYFMELYNTSYPNQTLIPAGDYRLTKKFGGTLTIEQFRKFGHTYKQIPSIVCVPELKTFQSK
jgi:hypothetical protein